MVVARPEVSARAIVQRVVAVETAALLALVTVLWIFQPETAASGFWGGMVFLVPNAYFTLYAFRYSGAESALSVALSLHRGQIGKLLLVAVGFALAFRFVQPLHAWCLFLGYLYVLAVHIAVAAKISERFSRTQPNAGRDTKA